MLPGHLTNVHLVIFAGGIGTVFSHKSMPSLRMQKAQWKLSPAVGVASRYEAHYRHAFINLMYCIQHNSNVNAYFFVITMFFLHSYLVLSLQQLANMSVIGLHLIQQLQRCVDVSCFKSSHWNFLHYFALCFAYFIHQLTFPILIKSPKEPYLFFTNKRRPNKLQYAPYFKMRSSGLKWTDIQPNCNRTNQSLDFNTCVVNIRAGKRSSDGSHGAKPCFKTFFSSY